MQRSGVWMPSGRSRTWAGKAASLAAAAALVVAGCEPATSTPAPEPVQTQPPAGGFTVSTVVEGLQHPWGIAFLPGGDMLVTERPGRLRLIQAGSLVPEPVGGVPEVRAQGQGGLLDVALHPDFENNRLVYLSYSKPGSGGATTAVARGRLEGRSLVGVQDIFVGEAWGTGGQHFGSRLEFDRQGHLFITIGDRGTPNRAQNLGDHAGTTIRIHDDGRVPADNPFVGREGARPEIYTYGNRNPQGLALHPETGEIWQNEHGPRGGDELNLIQAGMNYGWPEVSFGDHYDGRRIPNPTEGSGIAMPLLHWTPSIAVSGLTFYTGDAFPEWRGNAFVGALAHQQVRRLVLDGTRVVEQEVMLDGRGQRIRAIREGPDGFLYVLVDASSAPLLRIQPARGEG
jgi:aldose sugar dehydrogenase